MPATDGRLWKILDHDDETTVLVDLNTETGFQVGEGADIGKPGIRRTSLQQGGIDGEDVVRSDLANTVVTLPLIIVAQADIAAVDALYASLLAAVDRQRFTLEFRPKGASTSFLMDCFRAAPPSLYRGQRKQPDCVLFDGYIPLEFERLPYMRGAAVHT